jgi:SPP1 gp7 family putative phage head morphogenesis protein
MTMTTTAKNERAASNDIVLRATRPNAGIEAVYRKRVNALIEDMNKSLIYWLASAYRQNPPEMASDDSPATDMREAMRRMAKQWQTKFDAGADRLSKWFAQKNKDYSDAALKTILKDAGITVQFSMTAPMNDVFQAVISEQVGLIKSIASQHLTQVETLVMQSVQRGRDLGWLTDKLTKQYGITKRRAALIARDQNNKATAVLNNVRQRELGITEGIWRHSAAGKQPRPSHVHADGQKFDLSKGMYLDGKWVLPGEEINCRCTVQPIIKGFNA